MSVTVNDGAGFSDPDKEKDGSPVNAYYRYVNAVARGIREKWPDRYVAFISYAKVKRPPPFRLEDNVMLFLMSFEGNIKPVYGEWKGKVRNFGVYQWLYGAGWAVPNHWPHGIQDYLRWLRSVGGMAFKGEACIGFSQGGPKMWVLANLLWNVDADVDALLMDYYEHAYGPEAAPAVARYFARAEQMYERRRSPMEYNIVRHQPGHYQFKLVEEEDFKVMASALARAKGLVRGNANQTRLDWTTRAFELGRRYWNAQQAFTRAGELSKTDLKTDHDCRVFCRSVAEFYRSREEIERYREARCVPVPLGYCVAPDRDQPPGGMWGWLDSGFRDWFDDAALVNSFRGITERLRARKSSQEVALFWRRIGEDLPYAKPYTRHQEYLLCHKDKPMANYLSNGSFEAAPAPKEPGQERLLADARARKFHYTDGNDYDVTGLCARDWVTFGRSVRNYSAFLDTDNARDGHASLCLMGTGRYGGILHDVKAPNNHARYRIRLWYRTAGKFRTGSLGIAFYPLRSFPRQSIGLSPSPQWTRTTLEFTANYRAEQARFTVALMFRRSTSPEARLWVDDVRLEMLSPDGVADP